MANASILAAFERMWQHVIAKVGEKADIEHTHTLESLGIAYGETLPETGVEGQIFLLVNMDN
jgi:hypothetical protein